MTRRAVFLAAIPLVMSVAACASSPSPVPVGQPQLYIDNGTTLAVTIEINGQRIGDYGPGTGTSLDLNPLPRPPWHLVARSPSGRILLAMDVSAGDPYMTAQPEGESGGGDQYGTADLTCGNLLIWAGTVPPRIPPGPGPSPTGDCSP